MRLGMHLKLGADGVLGLMRRHGALGSSCFWASTDAEEVPDCVHWRREGADPALSVPATSRPELDHAAYDLAGFHVGEALVDVGELDAI